MTQKCVVLWLLNSQEGIDTTKTRMTRQSAKHQRAASLSFQLQSSPSLEHLDTPQSQPNGGKRYRANRVSYNRFFSAEALLDQGSEVVRSPLPKMTPISNGDAPTSTTSEKVTGYGPLKKTAPVALMYPPEGAHNVDVSSSPPLSPLSEIPLPENYEKGTYKDRVGSIAMDKTDLAHPVEQASSLAKIDVPEKQSCRHRRHERCSTSTAIVEGDTHSPRQKSSRKTASLPQVISIDSDSEEEPPKPDNAERVGSDFYHGKPTSRSQPEKKPSATINCDSGEEEDIRVSPQPIL